MLFLIPILLYIVSVFVIHQIRKRKEGYFKTLWFKDHLDGTYGKRSMNKSEIHHEMRYLLKTLMTLCASIHVRPVLMYGGLLGYKHNHKEFLPWDDDLDVIILEHDIPRLVTLDGWETEQWILRVNPRHANRIVGDPFNKIDARLISKRNGVFIDMMFHWLTPTNTFLAKDGNEYPVTDILPLKSDTFSGIPVFVPHRVDAVLVKRYGPNALKPYEWHLQHFGNPSCQKVMYNVINNIHYLFDYLFLFPIFLYMIYILNKQKNNNR